MTLQEHADVLIFNAMKAFHGAHPMRIVCSYCLTVIQGGPPAPVSHGICASCQQRLHAEMDAKETK
jgi:hypothetical protein